MKNRHGLSPRVTRLPSYISPHGAGMNTFTQPAPLFNHEFLRGKDARFYPRQFIPSNFPPPPLVSLSPFVLCCPYLPTCCVDKKEKTPMAVVRCHDPQKVSKGGGREEER